MTKYVTFGHPFKQGDIPAGKRPQWFDQVSGNVLPTQANQDATWPDGSLAFAQCTLQLPDIVSNVSARMRYADAPTGTDITVASLLASAFEATADVTIAGVAYTASARAALVAGSYIELYKGPIASEWVAFMNVKTAGGTPHPHIALRFHILAYAGLGSVHVAHFVENGFLLVSAPQTFTLNVTLRTGSTTVYSNAALAVPHHRRFGIESWYGTAQTTFFTHDPRYVIDSKVVPYYPRRTVPETYLASLPTAWSPMSNANLAAYMPGTGADDGIGPLARWQVAWLRSADKRAYTATMINSFASGSYSVHYRDEVTGYPVSLASYPNLYLGGGGTPVDPTPSGADPYALVQDDAHQPSTSYLAYLLSGRYYHLEEMQFWVTWHAANMNYGQLYRQGAKGIFWGGQQIRGCAWGLRELSRCARVTPDAHPLKQHFLDRVKNNIDYYNSIYTDNPQANALGILEHSYAYAYSITVANDGIAPWQDNFFTFAVDHAAELGFVNADRLAFWKGKFPVGLVSGTGWCYQLAGQFSLKARSAPMVGVMPPTDGLTYINWTQLFNANYPGATGTCGQSDFTTYLNTVTSYNVATGQIIGYSDQPAGYPQNLRPALSAAVNRGVPGAQAAFDTVIGSPRYVTNALLADYGNWDISPRGV